MASFFRLWGDNEGTMNIYNGSAFLNSFWDWTPFNACFGNTRIRVSDIDGIIERNGHFLILETKAPGKKPGIGQKLLLRHLMDTGYVTVLYIWGETNNPQKALWVTSRYYHVYPLNGWQELQRLVKFWFDHVDNLPPPATPEDNIDWDSVLEE